MQLGIPVVPVMEKTEIPDSSASGSKFSDALEKASGTTDKRSGAVGSEKENTSSAVKEKPAAAEQSQTDEEPAAEETESTECPAEMLTLDLLFGTEITQVVTAETSAAQPVEGLTVTAEALPEQMQTEAAETPLPVEQPAEAEVIAVGTEVTITESAPAQAQTAELPDATEFMKTIRERLEQDLATAKAVGEPADTETATVETATVETVTAEAVTAAPDAAEAETAGQSGTDGSAAAAESFAELLGGERSEKTEFVPAPELQVLQTLAQTAEPIVAKLDPMELTQAISKAMDSMTADLQSIDIQPSEITIALDPEELGSITITISSEENHLTAKITTSNKEAADLLSSQLDHYIQTMQEKGVKVDKAEVAYNQLDQDGSSRNGRDRDPQHRHRTAEFRIDGIERAERSEGTVPEAPTAMRDVYERGADDTIEDVYVPGYRV
ncbi:MAG: hypothetical protein E7472_00760 [Ruminococcaceae bacterium]|nr:hypothetical protein [Oscillospiraceae bacterium]